MEQYNITGMSCAACSARVERAVSALDGVTSCSVNLLTNSMNVEGDVSPDRIIEAVISAGYGASPKGRNVKAESQENSIKDTETPKIKKRLWWSVAILAPLMYLSMGHTMWHFPLPDIIARNPMTVGLIQMILAALVMIINQKFFINGVKGLFKLSPNMDTLVSLGSLASFGYSFFVLFLISEAQMSGDHSLAMSYLHDLYFESAAMILTLITVGKMLEARAKGKTTSALEGLMKLAPKTATVIRDGTEKVISIEEVRIGDIFIVRAGEQIPVDGIVTEGHGAVNESALTGESIPSDKEIGSSVSSGTINESGYLKCEATRIGEDTTLAGIIRMVSDAAATKAPIAKIADKVSGIFVPAVIGISVITLAIWLIVGESFGFAIARAISVLVISCPCALGLATPVAIMVGTGIGAKNGILFKTAASLEAAGRTKTVALDKTGTITIGDPAVVGIYPENAISENELLRLAASLEKNSEHPLSRAIRKKADAVGIEYCEVNDFTTLSGSGLCAKIEGDVICGGNMKFIKTNALSSEEAERKAEQLSEEGKTPLFFARNTSLLGIIAVSDRIKPDSREAISEMKKMGLRVVMLTGDNERTANAIGHEVEVDEVIAGVLPDGKEAVIRQLKSGGSVAMVGDGINDAPALTCADIGIAIGAGSDIAIDAADIVLVKNTLSDVPAAIKLSRRTLTNIKENLFWAFIYNIVGIPLAAGAWYALFGLKLSPMFGAAAMSLSSVTVVCNALRLNFIKITKKQSNSIQNKEDNENIESEDNEMKKTITVEGMMCPHCEARVKNALEELTEVAEAKPSHKKGTAVVKLTADISDETLKKAVEAQGYKVTAIK